MATQLGRHVHGPPVREPVPARVGAADRVRQQHHARVRRRAGAASSPRRSACTRSSTSPGRRRSSCAPRPTRRSSRCRSGPGTALHSSWNWELISDKTLDWWVPRIARIKKAHPTRILVASIMAGSGSDQELRALADAREGVPGRRRRRARAEPVVPAHGPQGHGLEHRQGPGAHLDRHPGRQGSRARAGLGQAHAVDDRHRRRGARRVSRRRRRDHLVEHVPVAAADRSRDARVRDERRRLRVDAAASAARRSCRCRWPRWRS